MFRPPPGYVDCEADAAIERPHLEPGRYRVITVAGVGVIHARRPLASAVAAVAAAANPKTSDRDRNDWLHRFIETHLQPGELDALLIAMITEDYPADTLLRVARAIAVEDTGRPYGAVLNLALMTAHNWRDVRARLQTHGIADPMGLPSMHAVLDATEAMIVEATVSGAKTQGEGQRKLDQFYDRLYKPDVTTDGDSGELLIPPGFDDESVEASFDAFTAALTS